MYYELTDHFVVAATPSQTWDFFSRAENLPAITPAWMRFTIRTPAPVAIGRDAVLDYTIRWAGVPIRWRTRIVDWDPPRRFVDLQTRGPYGLWHHTHTFAPAADGGGVECADQVVYKMPVPGIGRVMHAAVRRQLLDIFRHRRRVIGERLGWVRAVSPDVRIRSIS